MGLTSLCTCTIRPQDLGRIFMSLCPSQPERKGLAGTFPSEPEQLSSIHFLVSSFDLHEHSKVEARVCSVCLTEQEAPVECFWQHPREGLGGRGGNWEISIPKHEEANHR